ncbi:MAG: dicarboxylate/amino acid:cation symporter [Alphaproteobacteria bacterium]|nr:dicarboxylate/amino acid:cation symporter [Alphaproteobacteria bacterium]
MCMHLKAKSPFLNPSFLILTAFVFGILCGYINNPIILDTADFVTKIFVNLLKLISVPIIFFSVASTIAAMKNLEETRSLGKKVISYTFLTTVISAAIGLLLFLIINPVSHSLKLEESNSTAKSFSYFDHLTNIIPSNIIQPFHENNVIGVLCLAILFGLALLVIEHENKKKEKKSYLIEFFIDMYAVITKITSWIVRVMPIGIWGFSVLFVNELKQGLSIEGLFLYLACVVLANLVQGSVILPTFLKFFRISPLRLFKAMFPAITMAFFTKSSVATLPLALKCAEENAGISSKVAKFTFPLCTTINMNACAAFILVTVLFVMGSYGHSVTPLEMVLWIGIATIAAVGNAGVPMGCYFLTSSLLVAMDYPLTIMGIILPFYALIDMLETALNIWSDSCVAAAVDKSINPSLA